MERTENAKELIERAERRGSRLAYDSGFLTMTLAASAGQREDESEFEPLGKCLKDIFSFAIARARGARGKTFVGQQVFVPGLQIVGTLADVTASGILNVSYRPNHDQQHVSDVSYSGPGDDLLIIVADERTDRASPTSFSWIADEKVRRLFERAESVGVSLEHDSGLTFAKWRAIGAVEWEVCEPTIRQLGNSMRDVVLYTVAEARGRRGASFVGQCVFVPAFDAFGILASSNVDGSLTVRYRDKHMESERTCYCRAEDLLVILGGILARPRGSRGRTDVRLTVQQSYELLERHAVFAREICDKCGLVVGPVRFTRKDESGVWCSRECRDHVSRDATRKGGRPRRYRSEDDRIAAKRLQNSERQKAFRVRVRRNAKPPRTTAETKDLQRRISPLSTYPLSPLIPALETAANENGGARI